MGSAVLAVRYARNQVFAIATDVLEASVEDMELWDG
jgi:hypothetical protein